MQNIIVFSRTFKFSRKLVDKWYFEVLLINEIFILEKKLLNVNRLFFKTIIKYNALKTRDVFVLLVMILR